ncbi:MAG TPA: tetratricopeptide repeat protein, partial [Mycobacteriales bacterium]|nr:tetratricopeptide repeat protein [Mycobacteriales bacterium]
VTRVDQVGWLVGHVPGACLVVAGSAELAALPWSAESVGALDPEDALTLAARQDHDDHPGPSVADRISADPASARELAEKYLGQPGTAIVVGEWLVRNPTVTLRSMLEEFGDREPSGLASEIRGRLLDGASDDARTLLATLALVPARVLTESAVAALTDRDRRRTSDLLDELVRQRVVERLSPARYLVLDEAASRGRDAGSPARGGPARLVRYYGRLAGDHARALSRAADPETTDRERRWFQSEDNTLTQLLAMNDPPREAAGDLWRIADALDVWFTAMDRTADRRDAAESMVHAAELVGDLDARRAGHQRLIAICLAAGDIQAAEWHQVEARRLTDVEPDRAGCAFHTSQGLFFLADGQFEQAGWEFQRSLERRPDGDQSGRVVDLTNLGTVLLRQGRADAARRRLSDALAHAERAGDIAGQAHALELLGVVAQRQNDQRLARERWNASRSLHEQRHDNAGQARCLALEAAVLLDQNPDDDRAGALLRRSLELRGGQDAGLGVALTHLRLGRLAARLGRTDQVRAHRDGGLAALRGWDRRLQEPPEVIAARGELTALDC